MSSNDSTSTGTGGSTTASDCRVIGGRATEDQINIVDRAIAQLRRQEPRLTRGEYIVETVQHLPRSWQGQLRTRNAMGPLHGPAILG